MTEKLISIEDRDGPSQKSLKRIMRMVPDKDKSDPNLKRMLAFRLQIDGEAAVSEFLIRKIRDMIQCAYTGSFYDFIKDDNRQRDCPPPESKPTP